VTRPHRFVIRLAVAALVAAAAGLVGAVAAPPAGASTCSTGTGVSVVVDFGSLGGGVQSGCVGNGAGVRASSLFPSAGFDLAYVQNEGGFVCRIDSRPSPDQEACVNTPPADAYWGLWWSDGVSGSWTFSSLGVNSLKVPDGAYVAFAWQTGGQTAPHLSPAAHAPTASPTPTNPTSTPTTKPSHKPTTRPTSKPSSEPTSKPTTSPSSGSSPGTSSGTPTPTAPTPSASTDAATPSPTTSPTPSDSTSVSEAPTTTATSGAAPSTDIPSVAPTAGTSDPADGSGRTLPPWVVPVVIVLLGLAGVSVALLRRRNRPSP
jgi:hypothetical protein